MWLVPVGLAVEGGAQRQIDPTARWVACLVNLCTSELRVGVSTNQVKAVEDV